MRKAGIVAALLAGLLLTISACAIPAATARIPPEPVPTLTTPPAAEVITTPEPAYLLLPPETAPGEWNFIPGPTKYIVEVTPASGQGSFLVSRLQVYPLEAAVGDNVTFSVVVTNTGGEQGTYTVVLQFDGTVIQTHNVGIDGGDSKKVEFDLMAEYGEFKVVAGTLTAGLRVFF